MSTTLTFNEERRLIGRRGIHERRIPADRRKATQRVESPQRATNKYHLARYILGSVFAVVLSIIVLVVTGLFGGASSTFMQVILIATIVFAYLVAFKRGFYS